MSLAQIVRPISAPAAIAAARQYRDADLGQRIAVATPHQLVAMLYAGGRDALVAASKATRADDAARRVAEATRALRILDALDGALDYGRGGAVAQALSTAYAQIRAITVAANAERGIELFNAAAAQLGELGRGWSAIATGPNRRAAA